MATTALSSTFRIVNAKSCFEIGFIKTALIPVSSAKSFESFLLYPVANDYGNFGTNLLHFQGKPVAGHVRHCHIGDHQVERMWFRLKKIQEPPGCSDLNVWIRIPGFSGSHFPFLQSTIPSSINNIRSFPFGKSSAFIICCSSIISSRR